MTYTDVIKDQTTRSIWSLKNVIACIPEPYWNQKYGAMPLWKHLYHTIHSLDKWYLNPCSYREPGFHVEHLDDLDVQTEKSLTRADITDYLETVEHKLMNYIDHLSDKALAETPDHCEYTKFHLILAQHRHLDMHIGMVMGFLIADTEKWPRVMGLQTEFSDDGSLFF